MCYFSRHVTIAKWHCFMHTELINEKLPTIKTVLVIRVPAPTSEQPHVKYCGGRSYKWNWQETAPLVQ